MALNVRILFAYKECAIRILQCGILKVPRRFPVKMLRGLGSRNIQTEVLMLIIAMFGQRFTVKCCVSRFVFPLMDATTWERWTHKRLDYRLNCWILGLSPPPSPWRWMLNSNSRGSWLSLALRKNLQPSMERKVGTISRKEWTWKKTEHNQWFIKFKGYKDKCYRQCLFLNVKAVSIRHACFQLIPPFLWEWGYNYCHWNFQLVSHRLLDRFLSIWITCKQYYDCFMKKEFPTEKSGTCMGACLICVVLFPCSGNE